MDKSVYDILRYDILENQNLSIRIKQLEASNMKNDRRKSFELEQCKELYNAQQKMKKEFNLSLFVEFEQISREYTILKEFYDCLNLSGSRVSSKIHSDFIGKQNKLQNICQKMQNTLNKFSNLSLLHNGKIKGLNKIFKTYGKSLSNVTTMYEDYSERLNKTSLGINIELYKRIQFNKNNFTNYINPNFRLKELNALFYSKLEPIYKDVKKKIITLQVLKLQNKLPISKNNYNLIIRNYGEIIYKYQTIQNILLVKLAFQNTTATKYYEMLNKEVDKLTEEVIKKNANTNKLSNKLGMEYYLNRYTFEKYELEELQEEVKEEKNLNSNSNYNNVDNSNTERKENNKENIQNEPVANKSNNDIELLQDMSANLSTLEAYYYQKYSTYKVKTGDDISFIDYLKVVNDYNSKEVLKYYELKSKIILKIYDEYMNEFYDKYKSQHPDEPWFDRTIFINYCKNSSKIIRSLGGIDSVIGEADLIDFYSAVEKKSTGSEIKTR